MEGENGSNKSGLGLEGRRYTRERHKVDRDVYMPECPCLLTYLKSVMHTAIDPVAGSVDLRILLHVEERRRLRKFTRDNPCVANAP